MSINFKDNAAAAALMEKYNLIGEPERLMEDWLYHTHPEGTFMPIRNYLLAWAEAKEKYLLKLLGGNLQVRVPINLRKDPNAILEELNNSEAFCEALDWAYDDMVKVLTLFIHKNISANNRRLSACNFVRDCMRGSVYYSDIDWAAFDAPEAYNSTNFRDNFIDLCMAISRGVFSIDSFARNSTSGCARIQIPGASKMLQISIGQKPIRVLTQVVNYIAPFIDDDDVTHALNSIERLRLVHSQILNSKSMTGTLVFSVHPMDFMTLSDNGCNWRSCMRWEEEGGEYHAGTLEMMTSSSVLVAYLESNREWYPLHDDRQWSNKKWRELIICTPNFMTAVKGYPYNSSTMNELVLAELRKLAKQNLGIEFGDEVQFDESPEIKFPNGEYASFKTYIMYNDTLYSTLATVFRKDFPERGVGGDFWYGEGCYCLGCGDMLAPYDEGGDPTYLSCADCRDVVQCVYCGEWVSRDNAYELDDGSYACMNCYDNHYVESDITGEGGMDNVLNIRYLHCYARLADSDDSSCRREFILNIEDSFIKAIPNRCLRTTSWYGTDVDLIEPIPIEEITSPDDRSLCELIIEAINRNLEPEEEMWYRNIHYRSPF